MFDQFKGISLQKTEISIYISEKGHLDDSGELGLTRVLLNISIAEFRETIGWSIGRKDDACRKKEKNSLDM